MDSTIDASLAPLVGVLAVVIAIALYVWMALALSAMFRKMGEESWKGWVPFLNQATVLAWGGFNPWLVLLLLIPGIGAVIVTVLLVISAHRINPGFGYGTGMTVLAALLFVVWASILGFGPTPWRGARHSMAPPVAPRPPVPTMPAAHAAAAGYAPPTPPPGVPAFPVSGRPAEPVFGSAPLAFTPSAGEPGLPGAASGFRSAFPDGGAFVSPSVGASSDLPGAPAAGDEHADAPSGSDGAAWGSPARVPAAEGGPERSSAAPAWGAPADAPPPGRAPSAAPSWAPPPPPAPSQTPPVTPVEPDVASWPSEIDDVSAVSPSPFPPSAASRSAAGVPGGEGPESGAGLISFVPGRRSDDDAPADSGPMTRLPATAPIDAPVSARRADPAADVFPELSGEVSAVVGSPAAGTPLSARSSVAAQQRAEAAAAADQDDVDETVMVRRKKVVWQLVPASSSPVALTSDVVILGRRPSPDTAYPFAQLVSVRDDARTVSKTHARLELRGEKWLVTDLGSTNGVLLRTLMGEEIEIEPGTELDAGERFFLGDEEFHLQHD